MSFFNPYHRWRALVDAEAMEPSLSWGLRMALASVIPVIWGIETGHPAAGEWVALSAECICWVALKGSYGQRLRILAGGIILTLLFSFLGSITSQSFAGSVVCMLGVAFLASLFRNLGDRGSGLALSVYIMFLVANAYPVAWGQALEERMFYILLGGCWNALLALVSMLFLPEQQAYRRSISAIWRAAATLIRQIAKGWDGKNIRNSNRNIYQAEKAVRAAIDASLIIHSRAAHQLRGRQEEGARYQLAQGRKSAALVAASTVAIWDELSLLPFREMEPGLRLRLYSLMDSMRQTAERMASLLLTRRNEDELLMRDALQDFRRQLSLLEEFETKGKSDLKPHSERIAQLAGRCLRMMTRSMDLLSATSEQRVFRAYPVLKTIYVLHPRHLFSSLRNLFSLDSHTARYASRTAIAAALATGIYKWWHIDHGYWLSFTVLIVLQPYFIATLRKGVDRIIGTVAGGIVGGLLIHLPAGLHIKEIMLFISAVAMIYFFRLKYRISAFFITLNLVMLFSVSQELNNNLILIRAGATLGGAFIAIIAGFLLLPNWDRKQLPGLLLQMLERNWAYFCFSFEKGNWQAGWTNSKRQAERSNSNAYDSFTRALEEPGGLQKAFSRYYEFITHNIRITRELNNIHLEEETKLVPQPAADVETRDLILACATQFQSLIQDSLPLDADYQLKLSEIQLPSGLPSLNEAQKHSLNRILSELRFLHQNVLELTSPVSTSTSPVVSKGF
ncbi:MAG: FUSC family protein [Bacteroidetes bacterium]|nr:FUSC family protein [Bacteroidota bacterium]